MTKQIMICQSYPTANLKPPPCMKIASKYWLDVDLQDPLPLRNRRTCTRSFRSSTACIRSKGYSGIRTCPLILPGDSTWTPKKAFKKQAESRAVSKVVIESLFKTHKTRFKNSLPIAT